MIKADTKLFAIYKDEIHVGNTRSTSEFQAIKDYINDANLSSDVYSDIAFIKRYRAVVAKQHIHY
jgi:hypothetical protein